MRTLFITLGCCQSIWQPVIKEIPCLCWGVIVLIALYLLLKFAVRPCMNHCHESAMKDKMFEQEKYWSNIKKIEYPLEQKLSEVKTKLDDLQKKENDITKRKDILEEEKREFEKQILKEKIKVYQEIIKQTK